MTTDKSEVTRQRTIHQMTRSFMQQMDGFRTFDEPGADYEELEDTYKRVASTQIHDLLDTWVHGESSSLSNDELLNRLKTLFVKNLPGLDYSQNFLNWRDLQYIFEDLLKEKKSIVAFQRLLHDLLKDASQSDDVGKALGALLDWLADADCPANISKALPSVLLWLWNPKRFVFIKPQILDRFLRRLGERPLGAGRKLTVQEYERLLGIMRQLKSGLTVIQPRDFIDIQSFYWVVTAYDEIADPRSTEDQSLNSEGRNNQSDHIVGVPLNLILYGPPGTGKTYRLAEKYLPLFQDPHGSRAWFLTFHQSYSYEDFVEGIKPIVLEDAGASRIAYQVVDGIFKQAVAKALS